MLQKERERERESMRRVLSFGIILITRHIFSVQQQFNTNDRSWEFLFLIYFSFIFWRTVEEEEKEKQTNRSKCRRQCVRVIGVVKPETKRN